ncbi:unnamed protein product [Ceratitis capitata]|uniref:(Mediterranean fruit fly) hypothetical protein n=1 Tax=Ceratitis capitata TaxID=7213 RepID=A0A811UEQ9_CERCA|nr:unnamed protein product [Ceratitis capitata]
MDNLLTTILNNLSTCNIQQLINYILTDESDITKCFSLTGSFRDEINFEFNESSLQEVAYEDENDTLGCSSGYLADASSICISDDWFSKELLEYSHSTGYADMDEDSHCSDISFSSLTDSITDGDELMLEEVNRSIGENSQTILELLQLYRLTDPHLKRALEVGRSTMLIVRNELFSRLLISHVCMLVQAIASLA